MLRHAALTLAACGAEPCGATYLQSRRYRGDYVRRYATWKQQQPLWFTDDVIMHIPDDFIPDAELDSLNQAAPGGKRRSSVDMGVLRHLAAPSVPVPAVPDSS